VMATLGAWGVRFLPVTPLLASRAKALAAGGPPMWQGFMDELREIHLGFARAPGSPSVLAALGAAYRRAERRSVAADRVERTNRSP
jgi:hypothetical protein